MPRRHRTHRHLDLRVSHARRAKHLRADALGVLAGDVDLDALRGGAQSATSGAIRTPGARTSVWSSICNRTVDVRSSFGSAVAKISAVGFW